MFAVLVTVLCLLSVSHSAPLTCENLIRPLNQLEPHTLVGRWGLVAISQKDDAALNTTKKRDSITVDFRSSSYIHANRYGEVCHYHTHNMSVEGNVFTSTKNAFNFTGTFYNTSCPDCAMLTMDVQSPTYKSMEIYLFSKRRQLKDKEMEEFRAQVECFNLPPPHVMDAAKELCPEETPSDPAADKTEGQKD